MPDNHSSGCVQRLNILKNIKKKRGNEQANARAASRTPEKRTEPKADASGTLDERDLLHNYAELPAPPKYNAEAWVERYPPVASDVLKTIMDRVDDIASELKTISLKIHDHPELGFQENYAHGVLTNIMRGHGFKVESHYAGLTTAWRATFSVGTGGRVLGVNSEMDALPGIGHACGHNLIAAAGVGVAIAVKTALEKHNIPGKIILLGTPAEEGGAGKIRLLEQGAYDEMDLCVMCHPTDGPINTTGLGGTLALQDVEAEFFGHTAHAAAAPWDGRNALDAAFLAYSSISVLRQQIKPTHRVHGIVEGKNWAPNVIPDYAKMRWFVRAPSGKEVESLMDRVKACFNAAGLAASCEVKIVTGSLHYELMQNPVLGLKYKQVAAEIGIAILDSEPRASTDFGNVTYVLPALHPRFTIPTEEGGGNHTPAFTKAAATNAAHEAMVETVKALACTSVLALKEDELYKEIRTAFEKQKSGFGI